MLVCGGLWWCVIDHTHLLFEAMRSFIRYLPYHVVPAKSASIRSIYLPVSAARLASVVWQQMRVWLQIQGSRRFDPCPVPYFRGD